MFADSTDHQQSGPRDLAPRKDAGKKLAGAVRERLPPLWSFDIGREAEQRTPDSFPMTIRFSGARPGFRRDPDRPPQNLPSHAVSIGKRAPFFLMFFRKSTKTLTKKASKPYSQTQSRLPSMKTHVRGFH